MDKLRHLVFLILWSVAAPLVATPTPATIQAVEQMRRLDDEAGLYGCYVSESLIFCSRVQDALVAYLHTAETPEEYLEGIRLLNEQCNGFRSVCNWVTSVINFYNPRSRQLPSPHREQVVNFHGDNCSAFYNTFKLGRDLTCHEREHLFQKELGLYLRDGVADRFVLDKTTLLELAPEKIYNFVLLPDGTIWAALERPGGKEYHVGEDEVLEETFGYPNHTILAGGPHQLVLTAGALILFQEGEKRLMFVSNKSGHYQPTFRSLPEVRRQLATLGMDEHAIILVPDVDLAQAVLKLYNKAQVPIAIAIDDSERLLAIARKRWMAAYATLNKEVIYLLAAGNFESLDHKVKESLARCREEATYMRSAYQLFSADHCAPPLFARLVLRFGKLKDAIYHEIDARIQKEAAKLVVLMERYDQLAAVEEIEPADASSFYNYVTELIAGVRERIARGSLPIEEYHLVKKAARELGTLFLMLAEDVHWSGKNYFLYRASALAFLQVNELMRAVHDTYVGRVMRGEIDKESTEVALSTRVCTEFTQYLDHLGVAPPKAEVAIEPATAWRLINCAKDWYAAHYNVSADTDPPDLYGRSGYEPRVRDLLCQLIQRQPILLDNETETALWLLAHLKRCAEVARNSLFLLDQNHSPPPVIDDYTATIDRIVTAVRAGNLDEIVEDAAKMYDYLSAMGVPTLALEEWVCTDQRGFNAAILGCMSQLFRLQMGDRFTPTEMRAIRDAAQAIADLMHLYRRCGLRYQTLPTSFYDTIADNCDLLIAEINRLLSQGGRCIEVTPECSLRAFLVTSRILI